MYINLNKNVFFFSGAFPPNATDAPILGIAPDYHLGDLISGTYCSRIFSDCDRRACRLQSPNFPGVYPRNLTCYYAVRQHDVPPGKHALITVRQPKGNETSRNPGNIFIYKISVA